jgi:hypothetical protein
MIEYQYCILENSFGVCIAFHGQWSFPELKVLDLYAVYVTSTQINDADVSRPSRPRSGNDPKTLCKYDQT